MLSRFVIDANYLVFLGIVIYSIIFVFTTQINKNKANFNIILSFIISLVLSVILNLIYTNFYSLGESKITSYSFIYHFNLLQIIITLIYFLIKLTFKSKIIINLIILAFVISYIHKFVIFALPIIIFNYLKYKLFLLGFSLPFIIKLINKRLKTKENKVWSVLEHELTHAFFSVLSGGKVKSISVTDENGGYMVSTKSNFLVTLSPYFFPTFLFFFYIFSIVSGTLNTIFFNIISGILFSIHISSTIHETRKNQPDLNKYGFKTSYFFVLLMNFVIISFILLIISSNSYVAFSFFVKGIKLFLNVN